MKKTFTSRARQLMTAATLAAGAVGATLFLSTGVAWADSTSATPHTGPDYISITGVRIGAPSEQEVSSYGGSHKHDR
ncbi:MAG: hypothetical protein JO280_01350, partial [Mycobacteriaceae bacterium]|nr:hypothetical protein [Mycobacteriaceae bacterium]